LKITLASVGEVAPISMGSTINFVMKILVIGGTGKVGSTVVKELCKRGADLRLLVRKKDTAVPAQPGAETVVGDFSRPRVHRKGA
jgi:uncharacterized protein YbjT (DUF2867 family)